MVRPDDTEGSRMGNGAPAPARLEADRTSRAAGWHSDNPPP